MSALQVAADKMVQRQAQAAHELSGAAQVMQGWSGPWPPAIEANWQRISRRCDRRWAAWKRLAAAASRERAAS